MADEQPKIFVDDDWKAQAQREKEQLAKEAESKQQATAADVEPNFMELVNLLAMQAMAGLGLLAGPGGERIPPSYEAAKHFIDLMQVLADKTKNNLTEDENKILQQVLYDLRMRYVQSVSGGGGMPGGMPSPEPK